MSGNFNYAAYARKVARTSLAANVYTHRNGYDYGYGVRSSFTCRPSEASPEAVDKRSKGRFVEYYIVPPGKGREKGEWKKTKEMTDDEKWACASFRRSMEEASKDYVRAAERGDWEGVEFLERERSMHGMSQYLPELINQAETWEDQEVNDWGKVKDSVNIYKDTPLISAVRRHDIDAVQLLLRSGLADPTLQSNPSKHYLDDCTAWCRSMPEAFKEDALKVAREEEAKLLASYRKDAANAKVYAKTNVNYFAGNQASMIVKRTHDATKIVALVEMALTMWPEAPYRSPQKSYNHGKGERKERGKHLNRMHGVACSDSQARATKTLRKKLNDALEDVLLEPIDEATLCSIIWRKNAHFHVEDDEKRGNAKSGGKRYSGGCDDDYESDYNSDYDHYDDSDGGDE